MEIIKKILKIFNGIFDKKQEKELNKLNLILEEIEIGDIIWANRELIEDNDTVLPEGHKEGPFIVVEKCEKVLVWSRGTSVEHDNYFELDVLNYRLHKKTYFKLNGLCIINNNSFIKKMDKLNEDDKKNLFRRLKSARCNYYKIDDQARKINIPIEIGDIINNNLNYLIIDIVDNKFLCIRMNKSNTELKNNLKFNDFRDLDYSNLVLIDINDNIKYINTASDNSLIYVLKKQKEYIENKDKSSKPQRGCVIFKDAKFHYIYGEEGDNWLVFEIYKQAQPNLDMIVINNKKYYTNYKEKTIDKKSKFIITLLANHSEIDTIRNKKKSYTKVQKSKKEVPSNIRVGDIIESNYYKGQRFIVIDICRKTYECISVNKLKKAIYDPILLRKIDVKLSNNKSIKGIKWLEDHPEFDLNTISTHIINIILETQEQFIKSEDFKDIQIIYKKDNIIIVNGEEYLIVERIGNMIGCSNTRDKGNKRKLLTYFNLDEISIEIPNIERKI